MNKPNGISDKVWEMAEGCWLHLTSYPGTTRDKDTEIIALAISKAIEDDRKETLAELAEEAGEYLSNDPELLGFSAAMETLRNRSKGEE